MELFLKLLQAGWLAQINV